MRLFGKQAEHDYPVALRSCIASTLSNVDPSAKEATPKRMRLFRKQENPDGVIRNFHKAWAAYIRGNVVSDHASRIIKNFLLAVLAEGQHHDKIDDVQDAKEPDSKLVLGGLTIATRC